MQRKDLYHFFSSMNIFLMGLFPFFSSVIACFYAECHINQVPIAAKIKETRPENWAGFGINDPGIDPFESIYVKFNEPVNTLITEPVHVTIKDEYQYPIAFTMEWDTDESLCDGLSLIPSHPLPMGEIITVSLNGFVNSKLVIMVHEYVFSFKVQGTDLLRAEYNGEYLLNPGFIGTSNSVMIDLHFKEEENNQRYAPPLEESMVKGNLAIEPASGEEIKDIFYISLFHYQINIAGFSDGNSINIILTSNIKDVFYRVLKDAPFQIFIEPVP